jgi:hypothetical protein
MSVQNQQLTVFLDGVDSENITPAQVKQIIVSAKAIVGLEMIPHGDPGPGALASSSMVKVEPEPSDPRADTVCLPSLRVQVPRDQAFRWHDGQSGIHIVHNGTIGCCF